MTLRPGFATMVTPAKMHYSRYFSCAKSMCFFFFFGCPSEKERERLKKAENQTSTSKQLELAAVLQAPSSDSRFLHHV